MKIKYVCIIFLVLTFSAFAKSEFNLIDVDIDYTDTLSIQRGLGLI